MVRTSLTSVRRFTLALAAVAVLALASFGSVAADSVCADGELGQFARSLVPAGDFNGDDNVTKMTLWLGIAGFFSPQDGWTDNQGTTPQPPCYRTR